MKRERQTERVGIRMTKSEVKILNDRAAETGMSVSDVVRQLVRGIGKKKR